MRFEHASVIEELLSILIATVTGSHIDAER